MNLLSIIGLVLGMALFMYLVYKGLHLFVATMIVSVIIIATSGLAPYDSFKVSYMAGFASYVQSYFLIFVVGAVFGKILEITKATVSIANLVSRIFGSQGAVISVVIASAILSYGGVSTFVVVFAVLPIALNLFREADIPRRFIPGAIYFGACTFACCAPGTIQVHNIITSNNLGTTLMGGAVVGFIGVLVELVVGTLWLNHMIKKAKANGEVFAAKPVDRFEDAGECPNSIVSLIPIIITLILINLTKDGQNIIPAEVAVLVGCIVAVVLMFKYIDKSAFLSDCGAAVVSATNTIITVSTVVGFGSIVKLTPAFELLVDAMVNIPGTPLIGAAVSTTVLAGVTGSASGGLGILCPLLAPTYLAQTAVPAFAIARVQAFAAMALDSLPQNGAVIAVMKSACNEDHKSAYLPIFNLSVVTPAIGTIACIILFTIFPNLP